MHLRVLTHQQGEQHVEKTTSHTYGDISQGTDW